MKAQRSRRGSAILVVLGMATFMVVSALSFSVYMRQSRQPSSYLHKNATTHHLAKAAVQRAMGELDAYLRADQSFYPGLPSRTPAYHADTLTYHTGDDKCSWIGRVFCPPYESDGVASSEGRLASPLTLEGLGYAPPPFVNELRFYAPKSEAARWKRFAFDAGRYSYAVLNVSDCFDVNTLHAYTNRNSGATGRISLAPLFEAVADHATFDGGEANVKSFEQFLATRGGESADIPFVSLLDFNLSLRRAGLAAVKSPFCEYVKNGGTFYGSVIGTSGRGGGSGAGFEQASNRVTRMMFTTDSLASEWDPARSPHQFKIPDTATAKSKGPIALGRVGDQPWTNYDVEPPFFLYLAEKSYPGRFTTELMNNRFSAVDLATLRDYLDADDVPTSLALPCTERTPSVVCIRPVMPDLRYRIERKKGNTKKVSDTKRVRDDVYNLLIDNDGGGTIRCVGVYPFKWGEARKDKRKFYAQAIVRIFFAAHDLGTHQDYDPESPFRTFDATEWGATERIETPNADGKSGSVLTLRTKEVEITKKVPLKTVMRETDDALFEFELDVPKLPEDRYSWPLCTITREIDPDTDEPIPGRTEEYAAGICPFDRDGNALLSATVTAAGARDSDEFVPFMSVAVRISMEAGDSDVVRNRCPGGLVPTVDLVPATMTDDALNGLDEQECSDVGLTYGQSLLFFRASQVRADTGADPATIGQTLGLRYGRAFLEENCDTVTAASTRPGGLVRVGVNFDWGALWTSDPRYNYAPENWWADQRFAIDEELPDYWADQTEAMLDESIGADSDIFMAVSNQEYLQSVGELGFLPRIQDIWGNTSPGNLTGAFFDAMNQMMLNPDYNPFDAANGGGGRTSRAKLADKDRMWRTYRLYAHTNNTGAEGGTAGRDTTIYDEFDVRPDVVTPAFAVNPFTESELALQTVFCQTPWNWEYASTNLLYSPLAVANGGRFPSFLKGLKYTWSENALNGEAGSGLLVHDDAMKILRQVQSKFRASTDADWTAVWNKLDWFDEDNPRDFLDIDTFDGATSPFHSVDRKFFYSYWRECFGNRQQLFLIYARAEPLSPGGSSRTAAASPQMGAKAVALVWRDPRDPEDDNGRSYGNSRPHGMRLLFYHQFE